MWGSGIDTEGHWPTHDMAPLNENPMSLHGAMCPPKSLKRQQSERGQGGPTFCLCRHTGCALCGSEAIHV